jgi:trimethylamine:corrinoid methyltransferase-like protein
LVRKVRVDLHEEHAEEENVEDEGGKHEAGELALVVSCVCKDILVFTSPAHADYRMMLETRRTCRPWTMTVAVASSVMGAMSPLRLAKACMTGCILSIRC